MKNSIYIIIVALLFACNSEKKEHASEDKNIQTAIKYAKGFTIEKYANYKLITLSNVWRGESSTFKYVLYEHEKPDSVKDAIFIKTPISSIACMSLTHIAFLEKLGLEKSIVALSGCAYVSSEKMNSLIAKKLIKEIGEEQNMNYEILVEENPNIVMSYGVDASSNTGINKLTNLGLNVVLNSEYMETTPLGKAEWIKFVAAFYNQDHKADSLFTILEEDYLELKEATKAVTELPTVFTGMPWNGTWYIPGAKSFQAQLFRDAGAQYLWLDNEERSSVVKAKEVIIDEAFEADFWLNQNSYKSMKEIIDFDEKFKGFTAVKNQHLYNNDRRTNAVSGNDYWESGVVRPDIVLKDLIEIFHPELLEHQLYYYRKLE